MSQPQAAIVSLKTPLEHAGVSALGPEKNATPGAPNTTASATGLAPKLRSCVVCRTRKVRCDKQSPCSTCRRANIACVFPSTNRPPKWARRLERLTNNAGISNGPAPQNGVGPDVDKVMERLRNLENLVKDLRGQLEEAHAAAGSAGGGSSRVDSPESSVQQHDAAYQRDTSPATNINNVQKQIGRLVIQDASRSQYVSGGFWSWVNDEASRPSVVTQPC